MITRCSLCLLALSCILPLSLGAQGRTSPTDDTASIGLDGRSGTTAPQSTNVQALSKLLKRIALLEKSQQARRNSYINAVKDAGPDQRQAAYAAFARTEFADNTELSALYAERDALLAQIESEEDQEQAAYFEQLEAEVALAETETARTDATAALSEARRLQHIEKADAALTRSASVVDAINSTEPTE